MIRLFLCSVLLAPAFCRANQELLTAIKSNNQSQVETILATKKSMTYAEKTEFLQAAHLAVARGIEKKGFFHSPKDIAWLIVGCLITSISLSTFVEYLATRTTTDVQFLEQDRRERAQAFVPKSWPVWIALKGAGVLGSCIGLHCIARGYNATAAQERLARAKEIVALIGKVPLLS